MTTTDRHLLTLSLDPTMWARLQGAATRSGLPVEQYCEQLLTDNLAGDDAAEDQASQPGFDFEGLLAFRKELLGDRVFPGNSADLIREARELRARQIDGL